jgi:hypothetical protein
MIDLAGICIDILKNYILLQYGLRIGIEVQYDRSVVRSWTALVQIMPSRVLVFFSKDEFL